MTLPANYYFFFVAVLALVTAPVLTRFRKTKQASFLLFFAWLFFAFGAAWFMSSFEPFIAVSVSALVLVLLFFGFGGEHDLGLFRRPLMHSSTPIMGWLTVFWVCIVCTFAALVVHLGYLPIRNFFWGKSPEHPNAVLQLILSYIMIGDGPFLKATYLLGFIFMIAVCVPIIEEVSFRGVLETSLVSKMRRWYIVFISAALFGLLHQGLELALPKIFFGVVASCVTHHYQSLIPAILIHGLNNFITICYVLFLILSEPNGVYAKMEAERLVLVEKDRSDAEFAKRMSLQFHQKWEREIRKIYEPALRSQMKKWAISLSDQDRALNIWEKAAVDEALLRNYLDLQTPIQIGDRRNTWRVKAWEKLEREQMQNLLKNRNLALNLIIKKDQQFDEFWSVAVKAISEHRIRISASHATPQDQSNP